MKVALVHDWLTGMRGGEKCLQAFLQLYPDADVYTLVHIPGTTAPEIDARVAGTSFLQKIPGIKRYYRLCLPLYPSAVKRLNLKGYDLVVSLSHAAAKNIQVPQGAVHICYCFSPMRYIWDQAYNYFGKATPVLWPVVKHLRKWDLEGCKSVNHFVAISRFVSARIRCFYGRSSDVIYPPVDTSWIFPRQDRKPGVAFLYAGALVPYKKADLVVKAFNELGEQLWIVGSGPEEGKLRRMAGDNISFFGRVTDLELAGFYRNCRALLFPGVEDFGMIPVECMAGGRPVIGAAAGGLLESVQGIRHWLGESHLRNAHATGVFVEPGTGDDMEALKRAVSYFIEHETQFITDNCAIRAEMFSVRRFQEGWTSLLREKRLSFLLPEKGEIVYAQAEAAVV